MSFKIISHDDDAFRKWCALNPQGYILNIRKRLDRYAVLHKVGCSSLRHSSEGYAQPFTGNGYRKVVSNSIEDLDDLYLERQESLALDEVFLAYRCKVCNPD